MQASTAHFPVQALRSDAHPPETSTTLSLRQLEDSTARLSNGNDDLIVYRHYFGEVSELFPDIQDHVFEREMELMLGTDAIAPDTYDSIAQLQSSEISPICIKSDQDERSALSSSSIQDLPAYRVVPPCFTSQNSNPTQPALVPDLYNSPIRYNAFWGGGSGYAQSIVPSSYSSGYASHSSVLDQESCGSGDHFQVQQQCDSFTSGCSPTDCSTDWTAPWEMSGNMLDDTGQDLKFEKLSFQPTHSPYVFDPSQNSGTFSIGVPSSSRRPTCWQGTTLAGYGHPEPLVNQRASLPDGSLDSVHDRNESPAISNPSESDFEMRTAQDHFLVRSRRKGMTYKEIREAGHFRAAESTLRGRFRTLTKRKQDRVRKPVWQNDDLRLLNEAVCDMVGADKARNATTRDTVNSLGIPWKDVSQYIFDQGGSYRFGNATCKKKWMDLRRIR